MKNDTVFSAILATAKAIRSALDYASRHFGKQTVQGWTKEGGTVTTPEGADAEAVKAFIKRQDGQVRSHLDTLKLATALAKSGNVTFSAFCAEIEIVRLAELERVKAEDAVKAGAKKVASATASEMKKAA